jgi:5-methylcytosine-specific restriction enzyme subunit McrC
MKIPIHNVFYLLLYAWDALEEAGLVPAADLPSTRLQDLFARVLVTGVDHVLRRGLDRNYITESQYVAGIRGRLDMGATLKSLSLVKARTVCDVDELSVNVLPNRILVTTLATLARTEGLDTSLRDDVVMARRKLRDISEVPMSDRLFHSAQVHRNNRFYRFLLELCRLIHNNTFVNERDGTAVFRDFTRDDRQMAALFEKFVRNFYRRELKGFRVGGERIPWQQVACEDEQREFLPDMHTDISLKSPTRKIIIDTKYYSETLQSYRDSSTVHSGNLYQLMAYLQNSSDRTASTTPTEGMLLYPVVRQRLDLRYIIRGHPVRVCTVDLDRPWPDIHTDLLDLIKPWSGGPRGDD